jgi:aldehyde dehydrogenase (NAD+)
MTQPLDMLVAKALSRGRISHLPDGHFIEGRFQPSQSGARMDSWDPGWGAVFASLAADEAADVDQAVPGLPGVRKEACGAI